ncbi:MAG: dethiobiotin synthase [Methylothermaceae bacterium]|nr:dethiobiotin synthase [Methylothermaceae bacterium]
MAEFAGLFITGTDTGVGKTFIGAALAGALRRRGHSVRVRKPAESGCLREKGDLVPRDAQILSRAAGDPEPLEIVCPYRFEAPVSPERAARLAGRPLRLRELLEACQPRERDVRLVEGAGGFYSPIAADGLNADLAQALKLPILLVASDRLGVIHQVLLTLEAVASRGLIPRGVMLNQTERSNGSAMNNLEDLRRWSTVPVYPIPFCYPEKSAALEAALMPLIENLERRIQECSPDKR